MRSTASTNRNVLSAVSSCPGSALANAASFGEPYFCSLPPNDSSMRLLCSATDVRGREWAQPSEAWTEAIVASNRPGERRRASPPVENAASRGERGTEEREERAVVVGVRCVTLVAIILRACCWTVVAAAERRSRVRWRYERARCCSKTIARPRANSRAAATERRAAVWTEPAQTWLCDPLVLVVVEALAEVRVLRRRIVASAARAPCICPAILAYCCYCWRASTALDAKLRT